MTIQDARDLAEIDGLDTEILLSAILGCTRTHLHSHPEQKLTTEQKALWKEYSERRKRSEPVAYILQKKEFYGRTFFVTPDVLIPRPATEGLIDLAMDFLQNGNNEIRDIDTDVIAIAVSLGDTAGIHTIADIGTGSGCVAITIKKERPELTVYATDISSSALQVAQKNADSSVVKIYNTQGSLLEPLQDIDTPFIVVSNPPYIPKDEMLMKDVVEYEPHEALFSGADGSDLLQELIAQAKNHPLCRGMVIECKKEHKKYFENI